MLHRARLFPVGLLVLATALALAGLPGPGAPPPPVHNAFGRGPSVVLVHGLGSRADHWLPVARRLARHHRVVLMDLPGHGQSAMPTPFSLDRAVEALDVALGRAAPGPVILVGHSMGGLVAAAAALQHPERISALVLVETALRPQFEGAEREAMLEALDGDYQTLLRSAYTAFGRDSAQGAALYAEVAALDSIRIKQWIRLALTADLSSAVIRLEPPVLVVLAARSWPAEEPWRVTAEALGYMRVPGLEAVRIEDSGHFVMLDQPAQLAESIERFIAIPEGEAIAAR